MQGLADVGVGDEDAHLPHKSAGNSIRRREIKGAMSI
jgi:hypothetical protein